ncbi:hypothetical protein, partial [Pseudomonas sp. ITEM 17296]|uniref:hypothetical protein n=1 Tax=Pseudomonas sp. ITEM 17296 TaxID=2790281 RepID=UPI0023800D7D
GRRSISSALKIYRHTPAALTLSPNKHQAKKKPLQSQRPIETLDQGASKSTSVNLAGLKGGGVVPFMPASELRISA